MGQPSQPPPHNKKEYADDLFEKAFVEDGLATTAAEKANKILDCLRVHMSKGHDMVNSDTTEVVVPLLSGAQNHRLGDLLRAGRLLPAARHLGFVLERRSSSGTGKNESLL